jgi:sigma-E factor negative regulatory protein RseC
VVIEEQGRVVAREPGAVWVETVRSGSCAACNAGRGCGQRTLERLQAGGAARVRALADVAAGVGDRVAMGIPEQLLLRGTLRVYLLPLLLLFGGALAGRHLGSGDDTAMLGGLLGLAGGFVYNRWYSRRYENDPAHQPRVLRILPNVDESLINRESQ